jgi:hypothetical protein
LLKGHFLAERVRIKYLQSKKGTLVAIEHIHTFLVHPHKGAKKKPKINGTEVKREGTMLDLLRGIYDNADTECDIDITFRPASDGAQKKRMSRPSMQLSRSALTFSSQRNCCQISCKYGWKIWPRITLHYRWA